MKTEETFESKLSMLDRINPEFLIRVNEKFVCKVGSITNIELVNKHPDNNSTDGFPKYKISLKNSAWNWCLISVQDFEKYLEPIIIDFTKIK